MFADQIGKTIEVYLDDLLLKGLQDLNHLSHFVEMFNILWAYHMKLNLNKCTFKVFVGKFLEFIINQKGIKANLNKIKVVLEIEALKTLERVQCLTERLDALNQFVFKVIDKCLPFF